jgi:hypothetical protein
MLRMDILLVLLIVVFGAKAQGREKRRPFRRDVETNTRDERATRMGIRQDFAAPTARNN